jgi:hypothetical protein
MVPQVLVHLKPVQEVDREEERLCQAHMPFLEEVCLSHEVVGRDVVLHVYEKHLLALVHLP